MPNIASIITGAIEGIGNTAKGIIAEFKPTPDKVLETNQKLKELDEKLEEARINLTLSLEAEYTKQQEIVNQTMIAEGKSDHFLVWSWRPLIAYAFIAMVFNNYVVMPYLKKYGLMPIEIPSELMTAIMIILGVASAGRSATQWQKEKNKE